jgi:sec-independent protein translocase protein TatA
MSLGWHTLLAFAMLGWQELLIILVIVVIIFGGAKIAGVGKASGRAIREFKEELKGDETAQITGTVASEVSPHEAEAETVPEQVTDTK